MPLVKLHNAIASIIQPKAVPPGTPRRVRAIAAAQIDSPVDAKSAAACTVVGQNTEAQLSADVTVRAVDELSSLLENSCWLRSDRLG